MMRNVIVIVLVTFLTVAQKSTHPALLSDQTKEVGTMEALLCTNIMHKNDLSHIHQSASWISPSRLARKSAE